MKFERTPNPTALPQISFLKYIDDQKEWDGHKIINVQYLKPFHSNYNLTVVYW